jgi:translocation and assembly module TamB
MPRVLSRLVATAGWALLGALALAGVCLSALAAWSATTPGRAGAAALLTRRLDGLLAGRLTAEELLVLPGGRVEVRGVRLTAPDGTPVVAAARARILVDLGRLARRDVTFRAELEAPSVLLQREADGRLSLLSALDRPSAAPPAGTRPPGPSWRIGHARVTAWGGDVRWRRRDGSTALEATGLDLEAEGSVGGGRAFLAVLLRGATAAPVAGPLAVKGAALLDGDRLDVPALELALGGTMVELAGEGELGTRAFRVAVRRLGLAAADARRLAPAAPLGGDVAAAGYAGWEGGIASGALEVPPAGAEASHGRAFVAAALRPGPGAPALGFDVRLAAFDPSRVIAQAPPARLDLTARGAATGRGRSDGRARLALELARSRVRDGELGPAALVARADRGAVRVERLALRVPGLTLSGAGRWREHGAVGGDLTVDASDLARLGRNLAALAGTPAPPLGGRLHGRLTLRGTGAAPVVAATLDAPILRAGASTAEAVALSVEAAGPLATATVRIDARAARARAAGIDALGPELTAALTRGEGTLSLTALVPSFGTDPVTVDAAAKLAPDRSRGEVRALSVRWPGARFVLARPAAVTFAPPGVDRLELADGPRSVILTGGLGPRHALDLGLEVARFDLARIPRGLLPPGSKVRGELSLDGHATGTLRAPVLAARLRLSDGGVGAVTGLEVAGDVRLDGTEAAPRLDVSLALEGAAVRDVGPLTGSVALHGASGALRVTAAARLAGAPLLELDARLPLDLVALLRGPGRTLAALARAPLAGSVGLPGVELAAVAGKGGLPRDLAGTLSGGAELGGTPSAPRGRATLSLAGGAIAGYRNVAARIEVAAEAGRTALAGRASIGEAEALRAEATLAAPVERLSDLAALRAAPLRLEASMPPLAIARAAGQALPVGGTVSGRLSVSGSLAAPEARLDLDGKAVEVQGRPLGDLTAVVRHAPPTSTAEVSIRPVAGGSLWAGATVDAPLGLAEPKALREAAATLRVTSDRLELGFLPALLPGLVRSASGRLTVDLAASGPLLRLRPRGNVRLEGGRLAISELGDWSEVEVVAALGDREIEVSRLEARRGGGRVSGRFAVRDLGTAVARLEGKLALRQLTIARAGDDVATFDLPIELQGTLSDDLLDLTATLDAGTIRLPRKSARALQPVTERSDIVEAEVEAERARHRARAGEPGREEARRPLEVRCRLVLPGKLQVKSERPAMNLELKGDSTWRFAAGRLAAEGTVEVVRGTVEPLAGRVFHVERARVTFPGGDVDSGQLDVVARFDNPVAVVTVTVAGTVAKPSLQFSSQPALDDAAIAMLIATGRTEMNLNTSGVDPLTAEEASSAVVGAAMSAVFTGLVADRLPVDQLSLDTSRLRAGKYVTDKIFVGYAYRFEAKPEEGENANEVKAEYRITPRWNFELRYGDAQAGDASLIWSKDY